MGLIETRGLGRRFGRRWALRDVEFELKAGEILGLVGPNGSGKSTLLRILAGFMRATEGEARLFGFDPATNRRSVMERARFAFAPPALFEALTAREHLFGLAEVGREKARGAKRQELASHVNRALERVGLADRADEAVRVFSFGMRQRLALAQALLPPPELLVLDEPTDGLDPVAVVELRELLRGLARDEGVAILVAGHLMTEMAALADRVMVLSEGRTLFQGPPSELSAGTERLALKVDQPELARVVLEQSGYVAENRDGELLLGSGALRLTEVSALLAKGGVELVEYRETRASLEEALIARLTAVSRP